MQNMTQEERQALEARIAAMRPRNPKNPIEWVSGKKVGPNGRCPCGSGKKHKKCCGGIVRDPDYDAKTAVLVSSLASTYAKGPWHEMPKTTPEQR